jgi:hypothetical protein
MFTDLARLHKIDSWEVESAVVGSPHSLAFHTEATLLVDTVYVEISCGIVTALSFNPATHPAQLESMDQNFGVADSPLLAMATMDASTSIVSYCDEFSGSGTCSVELCEGDSVVFSGCEANGGSCFGDTVFALKDPDGVSVAEGGDECGLCSEVGFTSSTAGCSVFTLVQKCYGGAQDCGGITAAVAARAANTFDIPTAAPTTAAPTISTYCSEQYAALEDLYHSAHGDGWNRKDNWLNGDPTFQGWYGVRASCLAGAACCKVTEILLNGNNLAGRLMCSRSFLN